MYQKPDLVVAVEYMGSGVQLEEMHCIQDIVVEGVSGSQMVERVCDCD